MPGLLSLFPTRWGRIKPPVGYRLDPRHPLEPNIVGAWLFNDKEGLQFAGSSRFADDISGYDNNCTVPAAAPAHITWNAGQFGEALVSDGTGSVYLYPGNNGSLQITGTGLTLANWFYTADVTGQNQFCIGKYDGSTVSYGHGFGTNGGVPAMISAITVGSGFVNQYTQYAGFTNNVWYHLCTTYDGANVRSYVNGRLINTAAGTGNITGVSNGVSLFCLWSALGQLKGGMDVVLIANRCALPGEVMELYDEPFAVVAPPVPMRWISSKPAAASNFATSWLLRA